MKRLTLENIDTLTISVSGNTVVLTADTVRITIETEGASQTTVGAEPEETAEEKKRRQNRERAQKARDKKRDERDAERGSVTQSVTEISPDVVGVNNINKNINKLKKQTTSRVPEKLNVTEFVTVWEEFKTFRNEQCASRYERGTGILYETKFLEELEHVAAQEGIGRAVQILKQTMETGWFHKLDTRREKLRTQTKRELTQAELNTIRIRCWRKLGYTGNCWDASNNPFTWDWEGPADKEKRFQELYSQEIQEVQNG